VITDTAQNYWTLFGVDYGRDKAEITEADRLRYVTNKARRAAHAAKVKARKIRRKHAKEKVYD
jgi:hypothetical protein